MGKDVTKCKFATSFLNIIKESKLPAIGIGGQKVSNYPPTERGNHFFTAVTARGSKIAQISMRRAKKVAYRI